MTERSGERSWIIIIKWCRPSICNLAFIFQSKTTGENTHSYHFAMFIMQSLFMISFPWYFGKINRSMPCRMRKMILLQRYMRGRKPWIHKALLKSTILTVSFFLIVYLRLISEDIFTPSDRPIHLAFSS